MHIKYSTCILFFYLFSSVLAYAAPENNCPESLNHERTTLDGKNTINLCQAYLGKVVVIVNTASKCGFTYQYEGLETLYNDYKDRGLVVIGFPSNDFGNQEPGTEKQIQEFCRLTYGVKFPMFKKTHVAQGTSDPLYQILAKSAGEYPGWNFHKYILDRNGKLTASFPGRTEPLGAQMLSAIEKLL